MTFTARATTGPSVVLAGTYAKSNMVLGMMRIRVPPIMIYHTNYDFLVNEHSRYSAVWAHRIPAP
jgi:hypothetical protein